MLVIRISYPIPSHSSHSIDPPSSGCTLTNLLGQASPMATFGWAPHPMRLQTYGKYAYGHPSLCSITQPLINSPTSCIIQFLQIFFGDSKFSKYKKNDFALWTESSVVFHRDDHSTASLTWDLVVMEVTMVLQSRREFFVITHVGCNRVG